MFAFASGHIPSKSPRFLTMPLGQEAAGFVDDALKTLT